MIGLLFVFLGIASVWHGFTVGGFAGFGYLIGGVVCWIMALAAWGMQDVTPRSRRPPEHPPGYRKGE